VRRRKSTVFGLGISSALKDAPTASDREPNTPQVTPPVVCAHGGISDAHPNTLEAIRGVAAAGLQCVEIDVSRTADDILVACHGRDLATLMGATAANVGDFSSDDVFALQVMSCVE